MSMLVPLPNYLSLQLSLRSNFYVQVTNVGWIAVTKITSTQLIFVHIGKNSFSYCQ